MNLCVFLMSILKWLIGSINYFCNDHEFHKH